MGLQDNQAEQLHLQKPIKNINTKITMNIIAQSGNKQGSVHKRQVNRF